MVIKKCKRILVILCILGLSAFIFLQYQNKKTQTILGLTDEQKLADFDFLCEMLDYSYPFWNEIEQAGIDKKAVYDTYRKEIEDANTDIEFFKCIGYFLNEFEGVGHLSVLDGYLYGIYTDTLLEGNTVLSSHEREQIQPLRTVLESEISSHTYSLLDQSHSGFRSIIGLKEEYRNKNVESINQTPEIQTEILDKEVAYIKIDSFELTRYPEDKKTIERFFNEIEDIPNLIIDLRKNSGGSDRFWQDLIVKPNAKERLISERSFLFNESDIVNDYISELGIKTNPLNTLPEPLKSQYQNSFGCCTMDLETFEKAENPYTGAIWVLVDDTVYSSSENFAIFCKNTDFATLVGTTTGGDGGIADPILVSLPNSGLIVRFSVFYGLNEDGSGNEANGTKPDITVPDGEDAFQKCLEIIR